MEEMLDIVNEADEVVGQTTRSDMHHRSLMHRATHIILINSASQIFMQLRSKTKDTNPGLWDTSAAGHVDAGESYTACAVRELEEELGVVVSIDDLVEVGRLPPTFNNGFEFVRIYTCVSDEPITLEAGEIDDGKWVTRAELEQWISTSPEAFASSFSTIWQNTQNKLAPNNEPH